MDHPIVLWPSERDEADLATIRAATGLTDDEALRLAIRSFAVECAPVAFALADDTTSSSR